jgi:hypothetical protein
MLSRVAAIAGVLTMPVVASAEDKIYPPGTDCANQPTIAERLLCGRQEFRRQSGTAVEQPTETPPPLDEERPFSDPPAPPADLRPPDQPTYLPRTSSPSH